MFRRLLRWLGYIPCPHDNITIDNLGVARCNTCGRRVKWA